MVVVSIVVVIDTEPWRYGEVLGQSQPIGQLSADTIVLVRAVGILVALVDSPRIKQGIAVLRKITVAPLTVPVHIDVQLQLVAPR